jgi:hypothetical protein
MNTSFFHSGLFSYVLMPVLIFLARICDVSIGTMRIIFVSKGKRNIASDMDNSYKQDYGEPRSLY